jgi:hypothetical protein
VLSDYSQREQFYNDGTVKCQVGQNGFRTESSSDRASFCGESRKLALQGPSASVVGAVFQQRFHGFDDASDVAFGAGTPYSNFPGFVRELVGHMHTHH